MEKGEWICQEVILRAFLATFGSDSISSTTNQKKKKSIYSMKKRRANIQRTLRIMR